MEPIEGEPSGIIEIILENFYSIPINRYIRVQRKVW